MAISYNKLWKLLVDKKMSKADLRKAAGIAPNTMTRLRRDEEVTLTVLHKICKTLDVDIGDIMEFLPDTDCEYIVVLGAKVNGTAPSLSLSDRIRAAESYLKAHPDTVAILSGGQGEDEGISEAQCMFEGLTAQGIDPNRLWLEDQATSTWENIRFTLDLIEEKTGDRPETIGLVSSEYHLFRADLFARECGVETVGIPSATSWFSIKLNYFMREAAGVWHYLILGDQY